VSLLSCRHPSRRLFASGAFLLLPTLLSAQEPVRPDTTKRDSAKVMMPDVTVTVTRVAEPLRRLPAAASVLDTGEIRRGRPTLGISESFNQMPGVYASNRYNMSEGERLAIRGFGSRSAFGIRGIQILLDGIPQTAPDGQSQLTNLDLDDIAQTEVLRGSASSLYGNSSGGVVSFKTIGAGPGPASLSARVAGGSFGFFKANVLGTGIAGPVSGTLSASYTNWDGFRQHSYSHFTNLAVGADWAITGHTSLATRIRYTDQPEAQNPGALTFAEYQANPDSAGEFNILRDAGKDVSQGQVALTLRHVTGGGAEYQAVAFGLWRTLLNSLAASPPGGPSPPNVGTFVTIDRTIGGLRLTGINPFHGGAQGLRLNYGLDLQAMRDHRTNARSVDGVPDTLIQDQIETVNEIGPFVQAVWNLHSRVTLSAGIRYDWLNFDVSDDHLSDGVDNSGQRTMQAPSGSYGMSYLVGPALVPYFNVASSFETPTTTELANSPNVTGGFNPGLQPQKALTWEIGARGHHGWLGYAVAGYLIGIQDAIVPYTEVGGRSYYTNAGRVNNNGIEARVDVTPIPTLRFFASYTYAHYRFETYRVVNGAVTDTLDGKTVPGVPASFIRLGLRATVLKHGYVDVDESFSTSVYADDRNTLFVNGWGAQAPGMPGGIGSGVMNVVAGWEGRVGTVQLSPFGGISNLFDRQYVGAVTVNGRLGRVYEPAPRRSFYIGAGVAWAKR
jgi:iron complex outermembrane receptor protein